MLLLHIVTKGEISFNSLLSCLAHYSVCIFEASNHCLRKLRTVKIDGATQQ